jgi:hypothetical protein
MPNSVGIVPVSLLGPGGTAIICTQSERPY